MSEKRFVYHEEYFPLNVREIVDNEIGEAYDCEDATDVLNELFDENEQLKKENNHLKDDFQYYMTKSATLETELLRLRKENEHQKEEIVNSHKAYVECLNQIKNLKKENEKLIQKKCLPCELVRLQTREIDKLKKENEELKQKLENIGLNEKNDSIKMIDGKVFIRM